MGKRYEKILDRRSPQLRSRGFSYITSILIYARKASSSLRPYARKNYATVEIHLKGGCFLRQTIHEFNTK